MKKIIYFITVILMFTNFSSISWAGCPGSDEEPPHRIIDPTQWNPVYNQIKADMEKLISKKISNFDDWPVPYEKYLPRLNAILKSVKLPTLTLKEFEDTFYAAQEYYTCGWEDRPSFGCALSGLYDVLLKKIWD